MRELINFGALGVEDITGTVITTRGFIAKERDTALRFLRAFARGMQRYRSDKEFRPEKLPAPLVYSVLSGNWRCSVCTTTAMSSGATAGACRLAR